MEDKLKHKHHIIPRHAGGTDDPSNLVLLTPEEHSQAHKDLFEKYGRWEDELAYKGLAGHIGKEEIIYQMRVESGRAQKGNKHSEERNKAQSERMMGHEHSDETKAKMAIARTGWKTTPEQSEARSSFQTGKKRGPYNISPEKKAINAEARLKRNYKPSPETRAKMSKAHLERNAKKNEVV
jgi:hypothetical protein